MELTSTECIYITRLLPYSMEVRERGMLVSQEKCNDGEDSVFSLMQLGSKSGDQEGLNVSHNATKSTEELYSASISEQEIFYSPLGEPDMNDLPSFAHQLSQGMVNVHLLPKINVVDYPCTFLP